MVADYQGGEHQGRVKALWLESLQLSAKENGSYGS
jgi:hypothetical protein